MHASLRRARPTFKPSQVTEEIRGARYAPDQSVDRVSLSR